MKKNLGDRIGVGFAKFRVLILLDRIVEQEPTSGGEDVRSGGQASTSSLENRVDESFPVSKTGVCITF